MKRRSLWFYLLQQSFAVALILLVFARVGARHSSPFSCVSVVCDDRLAEQCEGAACNPWDLSFALSAAVLNK